MATPGGIVRQLAGQRGNHANMLVGQWPSSPGMSLLIVPDALSVRTNGSRQRVAPQLYLHISGVVMRSHRSSFIAREGSGTQATCDHTKWGRMVGE